MSFNLPPGFGTRPGDRDHFEGLDHDPDECDLGPAPDPDTWREPRE